MFVVIDNKIFVNMIIDYFFLEDFFYFLIVIYKNIKKDFEDFVSKFSVRYKVLLVY